MNLKMIPKTIGRAVARLIMAGGGVLVVWAMVLLLALALISVGNDVSNIIAVAPAFAALSISILALVAAGALAALSWPSLFGRKPPPGPEI